SGSGDIDSATCRVLNFFVGARGASGARGPSGALYRDQARDTHGLALGDGLNQDVLQSGQRCIALGLVQFSTLGNLCNELSTVDGHESSSRQGLKTRHLERALGENTGICILFGTCRAFRLRRVECQNSYLPENLPQKRPVFAGRKTAFVQVSALR